MIGGAIGRQRRLAFLGQSQGGRQAKHDQRAQSLLNTAGLKGRAAQNELSGEIAASIAAATALAMMLADGIIGHAAIVGNFVETGFGAGVGRAHGEFGNAAGQLGRVLLFDFECVEGRAAGKVGGRRG